MQTMKPEINWELPRGVWVCVCKDSADKDKKEYGLKAEQHSDLTVFNLTYTLSLVICNT